ncbi:LacI family DNA-binding transcriptional regulator [Alteraurantiacibacter buctensis]|uniref:LacI family DNA-binding transcriptional regulator n=1 Tax=Alteraurantiacibacter buctensis TaxID=1503981 RepID=A0A844YWP9_9SPHN|nr:LacI family DNA-binding transcriptional regulator [Alteraurantiacibacter buctensis]MXO71989.1 LacI family DNA-binding transcriptional regulator [Alteraurantiacibacter buctensis]
MTMPARNPTLEDVAQRARVSTATVSRFVNNAAVVAPDTAERIREAIAETGYIPNMLAGGLASSKSRMVSVLIPHLSDSMFNDTIEAMVEDLSTAGLNVMLGITGVSAERTEQLIRDALSRRVDAVISSGPLNAETRELVRRSPALFIQIWELPADPIGIAVGFSHAAAGRDIARFAVSRGYRRPHLVTADGARAMERRDAFLAEWREIASGEPSLSTVDIPSRFGHARRAFAEMRRLPQMPDVVICGSDYLAMGLVIEAQSAGLRVPDDLAVMGFGNSAIAGEMRPTITTVDVDGRRIAREAIAAITSHQKGTLPDQRLIDVGFRIIARESA